MWWPYRFRDATGSTDPTERVRGFAAAVVAPSGGRDGFVEATGRAGGAVDLWFRSERDPSELDAWPEGLRARALVAERLKGRN